MPVAASRAGISRVVGLHCGGKKKYGGAMASTWSVLRMSCRPRSPVGLVKQPEPMQVRITISHSLPKS